MFTKTTICLGFVAMITFPTLTAEEPYPAIHSPKTAYMLLGQEISVHMGIIPYQVKGVLKAESNYNPTAVGDHGLAYGIAQFHKPTFNQYEKLYFTATGNHLEYESSTDQITLLCWMWKTYPQTKLQWSTYRTLYLHHENHQRR